MSPSPFWNCQFDMAWQLAFPRRLKLSLQWPE